jgi:hypothetical protein
MIDDWWWCRITFLLPAREKEKRLSGPKRDINRVCVIDIGGNNSMNGRGEGVGSVRSDGAKHSEGIAERGLLRLCILDRAARGGTTAAVSTSTDAWLAEIWN